MTLFLGDIMEQLRGLQKKFDDPAPHPRAGEKIRTEYWRKPGPTNKFDWSAAFDNDEPNDDGQMSVGYGATEQEAVDDLLMWTWD